MLTKCLLFFIVLTNSFVLAGQTSLQKWGWPANKKEWSQIGIGGACAVIGGFGNALGEIYHRDPYYFENNFGVSATSWAGSRSWERKYRVKGVLGRKFYTEVSDLWHFSDLVDKGGFLSGSLIMTLGEKKKFKWYAGRVVFNWFVYSTTASLVYVSLR